MSSLNFYKNRVVLNVLANSVENAKECYQAANGHVVLGVLSKNYESDEAAVADMKRYQQAIENAVSIGLGAGDPNQSDMVARLAGILKTQHVNQVFTGVGKTRALAGEGAFINGLCSPTGVVGYVDIATGPLSSKTAKTQVPIETAIAMLKDMGGNSIKFFPMKGLSTREEYQAICKACAQYDFALEPTGGIDANNFKEIVAIALDAGVPYIIPHVYSSIIDKNTGATKPEDVKKLFDILQKLV